MKLTSIRKPQVLLGAAVAAALTLLILWSLAAALPTPGLLDYGSFVASGRAAGEGLNPYGVYPLTFHVVMPGFESWNPNLNPPVSLPLFQLFDLVPPHHGFRLWWSFSLLCYIATVALLARRYSRGPAGLLLIVWAFALAGFWDTLVLGQIYLPLVLAAAGAWLLLDRNQPLAAGLLIGLLVAMKPNFLVWPALLLLSGHLRAPAATIAAAVLLSLLPIPLYGAEVYRQWFELIASDADRAVFLTNASLAGLMQRAGIGGFASLAGAVTLAGLAVWAWRMRPSALHASALGLIGALLASPIAWVHYTLFLLPIFFARPLPPALIAAAALLVVPVPTILGYLDAPAWQQLTLGSAYGWAVVLCLIGMAASGNWSSGRVTGRFPAPEAARMADIRAG